MNRSLEQIDWLYDVHREGFICIVGYHTRKTGRNRPICQGWVETEALDIGSKTTFTNALSINARRKIRRTREVLRKRGLRTLLHWATNYVWSEISSNRSVVHTRV